MVLSIPIIRSAALALAVSLSAHAAEPARIVFQSGRSTPINNVILQGDKLVIKAATDFFNEGQVLSLQSADHVYGIKPPEINQALAMVLSDREKAKEARKLLDPVLVEHKITAKIPGNFWLEAAKVMLVIYALQSDNVSLTVIGKEISDATPEQGTDPFVALGKALMMSPLTKLEERASALADQTTDNLPSDVCAFAEFYRGELFRKENRDAEALDCFLRVSCLYPSGGLILNAASEIKAADLLAAAGKPEEALALANSALRAATDTMLVDEANKRIQSLK
jgi:tetratricopeptide (TPR) repeat protein